MFWDVPQAPNPANPSFLESSSGSQDAEESDISVERRIKKLRLQVCCLNCKEVFGPLRLLHMDYSRPGHLASSALPLRCGT